jgi:non-canonical purine NTP pyrophosphatase (RdgB/HAM1 family)
MNTIYFLTNNPGKFNEIEKFLADKKAKILQIKIDLDEIQGIDPKKIITHKVKEALKSGLKNFFLEDTSLYINGLGHLPGPLIKWFLIELKNPGLARLAKEIGNSQAYAETIIAFAKNKKQIYYFSGRTNGKIVAPRGTNDFGWGAIFQPTGSSKTFGQMTTPEKHKWSMRIKAFKKFKIFIQK